jgi:hypothetical protein
MPVPTGTLPLPRTAAAETCWASLGASAVRLAMSQPPNTVSHSTAG